MRKKLARQVVGDGWKRARRAGRALVGPQRFKDVERGIDEKKRVMEGGTEGIDREG